MATQHAPIMTLAPASLVGNAFVVRYYNILHQSPHLGHRFYTEESKVSRAERCPETSVESATTLSGIHEKIMSLDYGSTRTEIMTVDSQESLAGSVLVMVTGALYNAGGARRTFVQTFVLAPQDKSYFIFNDMFRYLDGDEKSSQLLAPQVAGESSNLHDPPANAVSDQGLSETAILTRSTHVLEKSETSLVAEDPTSEFSSLVISVEEDHYKLPLQTEVSVATEGCRDENDNTNGDRAEVSVASIEESSVEEAPKKSYASILRLQKNSSKVPVSATSAASSSNVSSTPTQQCFSCTATQAVQSLDQPLTGSMPSPDHLEDTEFEGDGRSVYVKNLPLNVTVAELEEEFSKFGQLKPGGVNLHNQRIGVCYAFIEFEEASSVQRTTEASPINMNGRQVYIEEKRIFPFRGGRGRSIQGRGYQSDGTKGRSSYFSNGGRGMGRGMGRGTIEDFGRGRGVLAAAGRGGSFHMPNTFRRFDSQNGIFRPMRRAGNPMGQNAPLTRNGIMVAAA